MAAAIRDLGDIGQALALEHPLSDGTSIYSVYVHISVKSDLNVGTEVSMDEQVGEIADITSSGLSPHVHFELRNKAVDPNDLWPNDLGNGYYTSEEKLLADGFNVDPSDFIDAHLGGDGFETKLTASDAEANDKFGYSVAIDGDTVVVGAYLNDDAKPDSGSVYVFRRSGTDWTQEAKLTANDAAVSDFFGWSVAIDGDIIVVGALYDDDAGTNSGSAYVFRRNGTKWTQVTKLIGRDTSIRDEFGFSVAIDGDIVVVGALYDDDTGFNSGSAYVFRGIGSLWVEEAKLAASDAEEDDEFGVSVGIDGDAIVVGASRDDDSGGSSGSAYVFRRSDTIWNEESKLTASDGASIDQFGVSIGIDGDTVVVGASGDDGNRGSTYAFQWDGLVWTEEAKLVVGDSSPGDTFGQSVSINKGTVVIGASGNNSAGTASGAAYVFRRSGSNWLPESKLAASDAQAGDRFGISVAVSGDTIVAGAYLDDAAAGADAGSAYVYKLAPLQCSLDLQLGYASGTLTMDFDVGTIEPAAWGVWGIVQGKLYPVWSMPIPVIDPPVSFSIPFPGVPQLGKIVVLTALTASEGVVCFDFDVVDTAAPSSGASPEELRELFRSVEAVIPSN